MNSSRAFHGAQLGELCRELVIQPARANPSAIYAATDNGVFKSTDGGASWTAANAGLAGIVVVSLAIDPSNPATLYAGTAGSRVFKTTNGGQSWTAASSGLDDTIILSLAIDPANSNTIYCGTATSAFFPGSGVFKSTDGAQSWIVSNSGLPVAIIDVLRIDPSSPATIYAGTNFAGVFKSTNGGQSWTAANSGMTPALVEDVAVDPANSATYALSLDDPPVWTRLATANPTPPPSSGGERQFIADCARDRALLVVGGDLSVGYRAHDDQAVHLFCVETVGAHLLSPKAVCTLRGGS